MDEQQEQPLYTVIDNWPEEPRHTAHTPAPIRASIHTNDALSQAGIYAITHRATGRRYIGSATFLARRWSAHCHQLERNVHHNRRLQKDWVTDGADAFEFIIIEYITDLQTLITRELHYFDALTPYYNTNRIPGSRKKARLTPKRRQSSNPLTPERAASIAARNRSPEQRAAVSRGSKGKPSPNRGWKNKYMTQDEFVVAYAKMPSIEIARLCRRSQGWVTLWAARLGLPPRYRAGGTGLLRQRTPLPAGTWGQGREQCTQCGTTKNPHKAFGLCLTCYNRKRTLERNPNAPLRKPRRR